MQYAALLLAASCFIHWVVAHDAHQVPFGLTIENETPESMLQHHEDVDTTHEKKFSGETLAYVTPWNNHGYDVVKIFKGKFDYISPVWYYIEPEFKMVGEHDVDKGWMDEVKQGGKVVPRFQFRGWDVTHYQSFVSDAKTQAPKLVEKIMHQVKEYEFDGIVLECGYPSFFPLFIQLLSQELHQLSKELIVVLPPFRSDEQKAYLNADIFAALARLVDRFSIMTYDYSSHLPAGGPSSPIDWVIDNIEALTNDENRHQLLVGLNMYAMAYHEHKLPQAMVLKSVLDEFKDSVEEDEPLEWDKESQEHYVKDADGSTIWLPTLKSIGERIHIAEDYGVGLALWEVGQGLDYFYNLF
ncbi:glycoside hydrolase superfamily [Fennellomyces sp. T-0311]|nr:glycoside hydrolase superfamily [Fennellomyces sp. T-0311]